ncbi:MAG: IS630 family transposase [Solirubrobacteraceae bacterium MAG38_C4-C5]|nr:IS630 family transposase [Candidatus Siliceabacter maunaloa]
MGEVGDARSLSGEAQAALRERGVGMLGQGHSHSQVAAALGVGLRTVAGWSARFRVGGMDGLRERRRGRRAGEQMALSQPQQAQVVRTMMGSNPDQLELGEGVLWSRGAVRALIAKLFGVALSRQTVGRYLRAWGWSSKKPAKRWAQQDPARVGAWLEHEYPAIQARAQAQGAKILWADEMGLRAGQTAGTSYAPVGQRAVTPLTGKRFAVNVISAIANDGTLLFDVFCGYGDEIRFMDFADKLIAHHPDRKIFLIVDNHSIHKSAAVKLWQEDHPQLELFFLPPYAPEVNPDEYLNNDVHAHVARRRPSTVSQLTEMAVDYLHTRTPNIVRNYFQAPHVRYAQ